MLTICIPTYNRNELLNECLAKLLPQLGSNCRLIVIDNFSDVPVQSTIGTLLEKYERSQIRVIRNPVNLGGAGNLLRCLELCETEWLYCLGDDDLVSPDCLAKIEKAIISHPDALYINFSRMAAVRKNQVRTEGMREFIEGLRDWSSFLFMSTSVINAAMLRKNIRWGYIYSYSWAPFQAILLKTLNDGGAVIFSSEVLCIEESRSDVTWVSIPVVAAKMVLPEIIDDKYLRKMFARRLTIQTPILPIIYWARFSARSKNELEEFTMHTKIYISRRSFYEGAIPMVIIRSAAFILLSEKFIPKKILRIMTNLIFKFQKRKPPVERKFDYDRT